MRKRNGIILAVIGYIVFFFCMEGWGGDWRLYSENDSVAFYYDAEGMTLPSKGIIRVWEKRVFKETFVTETAKTMGDIFKTLNYAIILREVDCTKKRSWIVTSHAYSTEYRVLSSTDDEDAAWNFMVPFTIYHEFYKRVCK